MVSYRRRLPKNSLRGNQRQVPIASPMPSPRPGRILLDTVGQIAQIALAVVAIFGYFYTVQPTYQKERLAEQVAEYDGIIKQQTPKIKEIENNLAALQRERAEMTKQLQSERTRLTNEMRQVERQLAAARTEKERIEAQIQFMTYRYRLPDGSPAVTREQVKIAQLNNFKRSYSSSLSIACALGIQAGAFLQPSYEKFDEKNKFWPFTEKELNAWKEHGVKYPLTAAKECINAASAKFAEENAQSGFSEEIAGLRKQAIEYADQAAEKPWTTSVQPADIIQEFVAKRADSDAAMKEELKKVEEEFGNWESTFGEARRVLMKHNYDVGIQNAKVHALNRRMNIEYQAKEKANQLRKSINEEIRRLIIRDVKEIKTRAVTLQVIQ